MVYIFSEYNFGMLLLCILVAGLLWFATVCYSSVQVSKFKKAHPDSWEKMETDLDKRLIKRALILTALIGISCLGCVVNNVPYRTEQLQTEAALVKLTRTIDAITEHRFGERCAFNGASVDSTWVETDTFPCTTIGDVRIWAKGATLISRNSVAIRRSFVLGRLRDDQSITRLAEIDFERLNIGITTNYAWVSTELKSPEIVTLTEELSQ